MSLLVRAWWGRRRVAAPILFLQLAVFAGHASGAVEQTQTLTLQAGWNAVWLEVDPSGAAGGSAAVEEVFASPAVAVVARPLVPVGTAEFITDPQRQFNRAGWVVWYRDPESGENTLVNVVGYQAYLVYLDADGLAGGASAIDLAISGEARFHRPDWSAGRYHLAGFNLTGPVTFGEFFGPHGESGGAHPVQLAFRLEPSGTWQPAGVNDLMRPGEAFWLFSSRRSDFMGPVSVHFDGLDSLDFGRGPGGTSVADGAGGSLPVSLREIRFTNGQGSGRHVVLRALDSGPGGAPDPSDADLGIYEIELVPDEFARRVGANGEFDVWDIGELAAGDSRSVTLGAHRRWDSGATVRDKLYRVESGAHFTYLPVSAEQQGVVGAVEEPAQTAAGFGGLWAGTVVFDSVDQLSGGQGASNSTTSTAPMRLLIHVDGGGNASLLNQVTVMQQNGDQVLVVDDAKLPFYEGVETRDGKLVGLRVTTVGYDMPRDWSTETQSDLVAEVAAAENIDPDDVTPEDIETYVNGRTERPVALAEVYSLTWPMTGSLGGTLTSTEPLQLDPFHRSNPFRHAFHPQHGAGLPLSRAVTIAIGDSTELGVVTGTYQEVVAGLADDPVTASGAVRLQRVSTVTALQ